MSTTTNTTPPLSETTGLGGLCLSSGAEGYATAALCDLQEVLNDINYQDLLQSEEMAVTTNDAAEASAENTIEEGQEMFVESLAQGIGGIAGSAISLGTMAYGEYSDPGKADLEQIKEQRKGVQNYKSALPEDRIASIDERAGLKADTELDTGSQELTPDHKEAVQDKVDEIKKQKSFVDQNGKALEVSKEDETLLSTLDETQTKELNSALDERLEKLNEQELGAAKDTAARRQTFATIGQAIEHISNGIGAVISGFAKEAAAEFRADSQLASTAVQSLMSTMSQMIKTANDALSQAQQTIQNMATISNGNKYNH